MGTMETFNFLKAIDPNSSSVGPIVVEAGGVYASMFFAYFPDQERTVCSLMGGFGTGDDRADPVIHHVASVTRFHSDTNNLYVGRREALTKVLKLSGMGKESRQLIWKRFNETEALNISLLDLDREIKKTLAANEAAKQAEVQENSKIELLKETAVGLIEVARQLAVNPLADRDLPAMFEELYALEVDVLGL